MLRLASSESLAVAGGTQTLPVSVRGASSGSDCGQRGSPEDAVAFLDIGHAFADFNDFAGDVGAEDERVLLDEKIVILDLLAIGPKLAG